MNDVIIDNTVLAHFMDAGHEDLLDKSRSLFSRFLIPEQVFAEFCNVPPSFFLKRQVFADSIRLDYGFFQICNTVDPIVFGLLKTKKGVDAGEAEAIAQAAKRNITIFLTDDTRCKNFITDNYPHIRCFGTAFLIALLDVHKFLSEPTSVWTDFQIKSKDIRNGYLEAYKFKGLYNDKKYIKYILSAL